MDTNQPPLPDEIGARYSPEQIHTRLAELTAVIEAAETARAERTALGALGQSLYPEQFRQVDLAVQWGTSQQAVSKARKAIPRNASSFLLGRLFALGSIAYRPQAPQHDQIVNAKIKASAVWPQIAYGPTRRLVTLTCTGIEARRGAALDVLDDVRRLAADEGPTDRDGDRGPYESRELRELLRVLLGQDPPLTQPTGRRLILSELQEHLISLGEGVQSMELRKAELLT